MDHVNNDDGMPHGPVPEFARPWLGRRCRVWLDRAATPDEIAAAAAGPFPGPWPTPAADVTVIGVLVDVDQWGEGVVDTDEGRRWVWPVLQIGEAP